MLVLRRGTVVESGPVDGPRQRIVVESGGDRRPAVADVPLVGPSEVGDDVVVNGQALDLALGSGGFDVVHVNLTRGLGGAGTPGAHVMKLNYSSLQHAVHPVEGDELVLPLGRPVAVFGLHGQLAPLAWAFGEAAPGARLGYVQTAGGALPGGHSRVVADLRSRGLLAAHVTAAPTYGGEGEAITTAGGIHHVVRDLGCDAVVVGPGPGILGSGSALGHGGIIALDSAHAALALGCEVVLCARMSDGDPRPRHQGLSHHTRTVLQLLLAPVEVAVPRSAEARRGPDGQTPVEILAETPHATRLLDADLDGYAATGLPARTMGRDLAADPAFFAAALVCGTALAGKVGS